MGACIDYTVFQDRDRNQLQVDFKNATDQARYQNGHGGYSGTIAEMFGIGQFVDLGKSYQEAYDYLQENHQKWDDAMAVSFIDFKDNKKWMVGGWCSS